MLGNSSQFESVVEDAVYPNDSSITTNWTSVPFGCSDWKLENHPLFQVANGVLLLGLLSPHWKHGDLFLHGTFVLGFLLLTVWAWMILCSPDYFSWNFVFMIINIIQTFILLYDLKPVKFDERLEKLYAAVFQPMDVSRQLFKKLVDENFCIVSTLHEGDAYAVQGITKTDRLGLLVEGSVKVFSHQNFLHHVREMEFIDSPEFESSVTGEEKFQVSVYAASFCTYIYWPRQSLEYLLVKEPFLAHVLNTLMGRDITNKLYALNNRAKDSNGKGLGIIGQDLRRTLAQLSTKGGFVNVRVPPAINMNNLKVDEESDEPEIEGPYSAAEEEVDLIADHDNGNFIGSSPACSSLHSGIQFNLEDN